MNKIKVLDVTLRDGGIVNNFNFGEKNMKTILSALENSGIKYIELGYLEKFTGTERGRTQYCNEKVIEKYFLTEKKHNIKYLVMMDYGKFDVDAVGERSQTGVDGIRLAYHKRNYHEALPLYETLISKGYEVYMQPMVTLHYTDNELKEIIHAANQLDIKGVYFVDTFGQMQLNDIERMTYLFHENLRADIPLGFHSHNNIQMAFANAIYFLSMPIEREKMLDSSIMGMGRGAGNLNTELLLSYLNKYYGENYNITPLLHVMDSVLNNIKAKHPWGYSVEYYLSSINDCSPIYASHYYNKHMLSVESINELLKMVKGENRISFKKDYAEDIYRRYNEKRPYDDTNTIMELKAAFKDKTICVIAPGKSIIDNEETIKSAISHSDITISLNCDVYDSDYELVTRSDIFEEESLCRKKVIVPSNITQHSDGNIKIIDYMKWITSDDETHDSAGFIMLRLLSELEASKVYLAGFDGFDSNIEKNYFDDSLQRPITVEQTAEKNKAFSKFIHNISNSINISFITSSLYEK